MTQYVSGAPAATAERSARGGANWRVLMPLLLLSLIPLISGVLRLVEIAGGPELMPANPRIAASPAPLVLHVIGAALYVVLGAFFLGVGMNLASRSKPERAVMTPLSAVLCALCAVVAIS